MNRTDQQFFSLLRSGLWDSLPEEDLFPDDTDWESILGMAKMQTVSALVFDGLVKLSAALQPSATFMRSLYLTVVRIEQSHELLNRRLAEIVPLLRSKGINPVLLKGQGVARNYPNPLHRQCGDIDLYIGKENYEKACEIVNAWGETSGKESESVKHAHFQRNGVVVEIHRIAERLYQPALNRRFQEWTKESLLGGSSLPKMDVMGAEVCIPPVNFNALYIFNHLYHHLLCGGVGLRQFCDWVMFLHTYSEEIDRDVLESNLKSFGLKRPWQILGCMAVDRLGLPKDKMPFYAPLYHDQSEKVLVRILQSGNFGFYDLRRTRRPNGYFRGKWHSFIYAHRQLRNLFFLFPKDVMVYYAHFLFTGVVQIVRDRSGK